MDMSNHIKGENKQQSGKGNCDEEEHYRNIINAFRYYRTHSIKRVLQAENCFNKLPKCHAAMLQSFKENLTKIKTCILHNYEVLKLIVNFADRMFENAEQVQNTKGDISPANEADMEKVRITLKQITRDWTAEGAVERDICYMPVVEEIVKYFPPEKYKTQNIKVLVPGAGLGRLAFEIARRGYSCQGNEFSLFMLFTSNFILNKCTVQKMLTLYPWVHQYCNNMATDDQTKAVQFPDINPSQLNSGADFSMVAGDFLEIYKDMSLWDCVATVFFIDTAHNIVAYIETIYNILKPGGIWVNFGPLLYHFADLAKETSIELSYEEVRKVILKFQFEILKEETNIPCGYTQSPHSMLQYQYNCVFFVVRKPYKEQQSS